MNRILSLQAKFQGIPFGKQVFSYLIDRQALYFLSIRPQIVTFRHNFMEEKLKPKLNTVT